MKFPAPAAPQVAPAPQGGTGFDAARDSRSPAGGGDTVASCTEKRDACIATTGCFTEPVRFGGETFCQLQRR